MDRRTFVGSVAGALLTVPFGVEAQPAGKVPRLGYLVQNSFPTSRRTVAAFGAGLREHGWIEGQNIVIEPRFADGKVDQLPALVSELVRLKVDIIVTTSSGTSWAAKNATQSIPIVMAASANALGEGLVTSLAHPSGNITGMTFLAGGEFAGKQLALLKEVVPAASRVAVLTNPTNRSHEAFARELKVAARSLGAQLQFLETSSPGQLDVAFAAATKEHAAALLVLTDSMFVGQQQRIADLAASNRLPAMYSQREFVDAGGLVSYGPSLTDMFRRAATQVDKILRGAKPGDIPVEQPTRFELVFNIKTREGTWNPDPEGYSAARGRGDPVMDRRTFLCAVAGGLAIAWSAAEAQQAAKVPRIGYLWGNLAGTPYMTAGFRQGLHDLGYVEGRNVAIEFRDAEGKLERLPDKRENAKRNRCPIGEWSEPEGYCDQDEPDKFARTHRLVHYVLRNVA